MSSRGEGYLKSAPSLTLPHWRGNSAISPLTLGGATHVALPNNIGQISPLTLGEGRILNELASCKNSGEGIKHIAHLFTSKIKNLPQPSLTKGGSRKVAFTLAETLITLGIIGVVAALVMPNVINHYKAKSLEVAFKRADSLLEEATTKALHECGYYNIKEYVNETDSVARANFRDVWLKQFKIVKEYNPTYFNSHPMNGKGNYLSPFSYGRPLYILSNGMLIGKIINWPVPVAFFDTNGPNKGPNRVGHDMFVYKPIVHYDYCNPTYPNSYNQWGCYAYAHRNIHPADKTRTYWEILYQKPEYWEQPQFKGKNSLPNYQDQIDKGLW